MKAEVVIGSVIGNYRVQQKLVEVSEFVLYSGCSLDTEQQVLLKAMRQPPALIRLALPDFQGRTDHFLHLRHKYLCTVLDIVRDENAFYIISESQQGQPLSEILQQKGRLPLQTAIVLINQVLILLGYLHQEKITCIDLRPSNIHLTEDNVLQLSDAGLVQLLSLENQTTAPETISALEYTAPERILYSKILGTKVDGRADLYAVGALFYELLTGRPPLSAENREGMIRTQIETVPLPLSALGVDVPTPIEQIIFRALEKSPERRFASAETMRKALQRAQAPEAGLAAIEPSLAFLMESLQLADAPQQSETHDQNTTTSTPNPGNTSRLPNSDTGKLPPFNMAELPSFNTGKLSQSKLVTPESSVAEIAAGQLVENEVPTLKPSAGLAAESTSLNLSKDEAKAPSLEMPARDKIIETLEDPFGFEPPDREIAADAAVSPAKEEKITLQDLVASAMQPAETVEIDLAPDAVVTIEPDDDRAFDELRSRLRPGRWKRKAAYAACALGLVSFVGCSMYWMARPVQRLTANTSPSSTQFPVATPEALPTSTLAAANVIDPIASPSPSSTIAPTPEPSSTASPTPTFSEPTPAPIPKPLTASQPAPKPTPDGILQAVSLSSSHKIARERERRRRAILDSLSQ